MPNTKNKQSQGGNDKASAVQGAQALHRAMRLLKIVATSSRDGIRLTDIVHEAELTTPTVHRLLKALLAENLLVKSKNSNRYHLGSLVYELGLASEHQFNIINVCAPVLKILAHKASDTAFLCVKSNEDAVCLVKEEPPNPTPTTSLFVGSRLPLGACAGGMALLFTTPAREVEKIALINSARLKAHGGLDIDEIKAHHQQLQSTGYVRMPNHTIPGTTCVGVPVLNQKGEPIASLVILGATARMTEPHIQNILPSIIEAGVVISNLVGEGNTFWELTARNT